MALRTPIGGLLLNVVEDWAFHVQSDGAIAAKHREHSGILRMFVTPSERLQQPVTHGQCLEIARTLADVSHAAPLDHQLKESITGPYGSARFRRRAPDGSGDDLIRVWYCNRPPGLIIGVYTCSFDASRAPWYPIIGTQCAQLIGSAVFNRPAWGGDDELTRVLVTQLQDEPGTRPDSDDSQPAKRT
jgi:hypothetical protein